jgi:hypothetical protein
MRRVFFFSGLIALTLLIAISCGGKENQMAFTRQWDNTFPPDTQAAKLLGQDLRQMREDSQQRIAAMSGVFAARPADFEAGFAGVTYYATDTNTMYQWDGAVWQTLATNAYLTYTGNLLGQLNLTASGDLLSGALPLNGWQDGSIIELDLLISVFGNWGAGANPKCDLTIGGATYFSIRMNGAGGALATDIRYIRIKLFGKVQGTNLQAVISTDSDVSLVGVVQPSLLVPETRDPRGATIGLGAAGSATAIKVSYIVTGSPVMQNSGFTSYSYLKIWK